MRQFLTIAANAFMELVRQPIFLLLMTGSVMFEIFLAVPYYFAFGDEPKLVDNSVLAVMFLAVDVCWPGRTPASRLGKRMRVSSQAQSPSRRGCRSMVRGTGHGTAGREIPVQSGSSLPFDVLSVQVTVWEQESRPLVMRRSSVRFR